MKTNLSFSILTTLIVLLIGSSSLVAEAQMFDGELDGLILSGGAGFSAIVAGDNNFDDGVTVSGVSGVITNVKIGYGISNQLAIYVSSPIQYFTPGLGLMYFPDQYPDYYLNGTLGFRSIGGIDLLAISGGGGYELRDHLFLELMLGYNRYSYTYTYTNPQFSFFTGPTTTTETLYSNAIIIAATFNYYFY